jgi:ribosomal protein S18 acetylase RimI-like enzyme
MLRDCAPANELQTVNVRPHRPTDDKTLVHLIAAFRAELRHLRGEATQMNLRAAAAELGEYVALNCPIFVAESGQSNIMGYLVCRVEGDVVWAESLYVSPACRCRGIGSALYAEAERLAGQLGGDTVYNWVHPDNDGIIRFLRQRGYNVLNLIELRRARPGEAPGQKIGVGNHEFKY